MKNIALMFPEFLEAHIRKHPIENVPKVRQMWQELADANDDEFVKKAIIQLSLPPEYVQLFLGMGSDGRRAACEGMVSICTKIVSEK
jgi:5,10-methenyltetrahydromethanopterin hydrogenase